MDGLSVQVKEGVLKADCDHVQIAVAFMSEHKFINGFV